ncbi:MAG TPA: NRDE family protein [Holophaga sp.]|nr:NRDE family protein [Holophaga sp.]
MCLILVAWRAHPEYPLAVAANRDEFFARPTAAAAPWAEDPRVLGGRDLEAGGTWLGIREGGRFAAVTNVREPGVPKGPRSRGELAGAFLLGGGGAGAYARAIQGGSYSGFNLLLSDGRELWYASNRAGAPRHLEPGIYGVSNHLLDTPWPKLTRAKEAFAQALPGLPEREPLFRLLADREIVPDPLLPATGVSLEWERLLSAVFVASPGYGTRASTAVLARRDGTVLLEERRWGPGETSGPTLLP